MSILLFFFILLLAIYDRLRWHLVSFPCHGQNEEKKDGGRDWRSIQLGVFLLLFSFSLFLSSSCGFCFVLFIFVISEAQTRGTSQQLAALAEYSVDLGLDRMFLKLADAHHLLALFVLERPGAGCQGFGLGFPF
ncbi:hypothetical protein GGI35DRAFT_213494 [Trichoderma velutinum]